MGLSGRVRERINLTFFQYLLLYVGSQQTVLCLETVLQSICLICLSLSYFYRYLIAQPYTLTCVGGILCPCLYSLIDENFRCYFCAATITTLLPLEGFSKL